MVQIFLGKKHLVEDFDSLNLLEMSIACCLCTSFRELKEIFSFDIRISANKLRIRIFCNKRMKDEVKQAIDDCYIIKHLDYKKVITYEQ